jgi:hypothetical protein
VVEAVAEPMIERVGVYLFREAEAGKTATSWQNLVDWSANVSYDGGTMTVRLRGIYPFELLRLPADGITRFAVDLFDGTDFFEYATVEHSGCGECEYRFPKRIDFAYQLRLRLLSPEGAAFTQANRPKLF